MRIERIKSQNILDFEKEHGLDLVVTERSGKSLNANDRFYARFSNCDTIRGQLKIGQFGNGSMPVEAIEEL